MKKLLSVALSTIMLATSVIMPVVANAEASATYLTNSDFSDCAVGGAKNLGYYGLNIIIDGNAWLKKGSSDIQAETYLYDEENKWNYCNFYANCEKAGAFGAGSYYFYQRDTTANYTKEYGLCQFKIRIDHGNFHLMMGDFTDASSNTNYIAADVYFTPTSVTAMDGSTQKSIATIQEKTWYTVTVAIDNKLQEYYVTVADMEGNVLGKGEYMSYVSKEATGIRTYCFSYIKNAGSFQFDMTDVTIQRHNTLPAI